MAGVSLFGMVAAFAVAPTSAELRASQHTTIESLHLDPIDSAQGQTQPYVREESVQRGDSVAAVLARMGIDDDKALKFLRQDAAARRFYQQLRPGKWVCAKTAADGSLVSLVFPLNDGKSGIFFERGATDFRVVERALQTETQQSMKSARIKSSLFAATDEARLPEGIADQLAEIFGGEVDFHQDLRRGDRLTALYETIYHNGRPLRAGRVLGAELLNAGRTYRAVYFQKENGEGGYYTPGGKSLKKTFSLSPLEYSRISSGFSARRHPILGEWRAHRGVDYVAPAGTRVKATADGEVEFEGVQRGYGKLVILRHYGKYATYYGHLNSFAPDLREGAHVSQGDTIGTVGMTGMATGPHLHYEFRVDGVQEDPLASSVPIELPLTDADLMRFKRTTEPLLARIDLVERDIVATAD